MKKLLSFFVYFMVFMLLWVGIGPMLATAMFPNFSTGALAFIFAVGYIFGTVSMYIAKTAAKILVRSPNQRRK